MSLHNSLLYDLLIALKSRRKTFSKLGLQKENLSSSSPLPSSPAEGEQAERGSASPIYFYLSQVIQTPNGIGTVVALDQQNLTVTIHFPDSVPSTQDFSCLSLSEYLLRDNRFQQLDVYHLQNLQQKWNYHSIVNEMPFEIGTPFQQNMKQIQSLTEEDLYSLIQPATLSSLTQSPTQTPVPTESPLPSTNNNSSSKKNKRGSNKSSHPVEEILSPPPPALSLSSPLSVPLMTATADQSMRPPQRPQHHPSLLFLKTGTLPYVVEKLRSDNISDPSAEGVDLTLELLSQVSAPSTYTHHSLPNPYDDSFFESIGVDLASSSKYQTAHPSTDIELQKLHE
jgi:hypothetical protein